MPPDNSNGRGPSWRWLSNLLTGVVGALVVAVGLVAWQQIGALNQDIRELRGSVDEIRQMVAQLGQRLDAHGADLDHLYQAQTRDHQQLEDCAAALSVLNNWVGAQALGNNAQRKLRETVKNR